MSEKPTLGTGKAFMQRLVELGIIESLDNVHRVTIRADCKDALWVETETLCDEGIQVKGWLVGSEAQVVEAP